MKFLIIADNDSIETECKSTNNCQMLYDMTSCAFRLTDFELLMEGDIVLNEEYPLYKYFGEKEYTLHIIKVYLNKNTINKKINDYETKESESKEDETKEDETKENEDEESEDEESEDETKEKENEEGEDDLEYKYNKLVQDYLLDISKKNQLLLKKNYNLTEYMLREQKVLNDLKKISNFMLFIILIILLTFLV